MQAIYQATVMLIILLWCPLWSPRYHIRNDCEILTTMANEPDGTAFCNLPEVVDIHHGAEICAKMFDTSDSCKIEAPEADDWCDDNKPCHEYHDAHQVCEATYVTLNVGFVKTSHSTR